MVGEVAPSGQLCHQFHRAGLEGLDPRFEVRPVAALDVDVAESVRVESTLEELIDDEQHRVQWKVIVDRVSSKVKAEGYFALEAISDHECRRIVAGEIKVSVPLVGGRIERGIADELSRSYESTAAFARQWLTERY